MQKGQLAILTATDGRRSERRQVNLAASLREPGAIVSDVEVLNLSTDGFMAASEMALEVEQLLYLKLPGLEARKCRVVWTEEGKAGFQFSTPLHRGELEQLVSTARKPIPRGHFGPQGGVAR
jgi:hypothetical protein